MTIIDFLKVTRGLHDARISKLEIEPADEVVRVSLIVWLGQEQWKKCVIVMRGVSGIGLASNVPLADIFEAAAAQSNDQYILSLCPKEYHSDDKYSFEELLQSSMFIIFQNFDCEWKD